MKIEEIDRMSLRQMILGPYQSADPVTHKDGDYSIVEAKYEDIKQFKSKASKERVSISPTGNTLWFQVFIKNELIGCCGLYVAPKTCRIKGDYFLQEHRGKGAGDFITETRLKIAKVLNYQRIEVLTLHPHYYIKKGFKIINEQRKGVWKGVKYL